VFKCLVVEVETQLERKVTTFYTDWSGKYFSYMFKEFCKETGI